MKTIYIIYELEETKVETFKGYSDGYGKEYKRDGETCQYHVFAHAK